MIANFIMQMPGFACHKTSQKESMIGLNMKMEEFLERKINVKVSLDIFCHHIIQLRRLFSLSCFYLILNQSFPDKIKVDSWWRWLFFHCSYCLCKCDAPGPTSDRSNILIMMGLFSSSSDRSSCE